jgi:uncharacterized membrane protein HdeD (DUF308 family)
MQNKIAGRRIRQNSKDNYMNKPIGLALLALGIILVIFGINATNSIGSDFSRFFTGSPTNKAIWMLLGGVASIIVGGTLTLRPAR